MLFLSLLQCSLASGATSIPPALVVVLPAAVFNMSSSKYIQKILLGIQEIVSSPTFGKFSSC